MKEDNNFLAFQCHAVENLLNVVSETLRCVSHIPAGRKGQITLLR